MNPQLSNRSLPPSSEQDSVSIWLETESDGSSCGTTRSGTGKYAFRLTDREE